MGKPVSRVAEGSPRKNHDAELLPAKAASGSWREIRSGVWTLQRFGLTPQKVFHRFSNRSAPKILCLCIPKAGTHLLERALCLHPRLYRKVIPTIHSHNLEKWGTLEKLLSHLRPGQIAVSHLWYSEDRLQAIRSTGTRAVCLIRDPGDIAVSNAFYISKTPNHECYRLFASTGRLQEQIKLVLAGDSRCGLDSLREILRRFSGWLTSDLLVVRYEDLVGPAGGGSSQAQLQALFSIYNYIGMGMDRDRLAALQQKVFSADSPTFRRGAIGQWRQHFTPELEALFRDTCEEYLLKYGYPWDQRV